MNTTSWPYPGSRWWRFDFHTHTPASKDTPWSRTAGTADELSPESWLLKYMEAEIECVAIADHNTGAWIDTLKAAYERMRQTPPPGFRELHLFPGVELSVNGGFHVLAIFDLSATTSDIDTLLGAVEYAGTKGQSDGVTRKGAAEVIEKIVAAGGLPIPAHVDEDKGLLQLRPDNSNGCLLDANTVRQVLARDEILAMEVVDPEFVEPELYRSEGVRWTRIVGSDCHNFRAPSDRRPGSRYTWIRMHRPTLDGLRLALLDGEGISVRRSDAGGFDPFRTPEHFLVAVEIENMRFMGRGRPASFKFSPYLNALIGGRGTGKSTVIHALRLVLRREGDLELLDEKSDARSNFGRFNQIESGRGSEGGLRENTAIRLVISRDGVGHRLGWGQEGPEVEQWRDGWEPAESQLITKDRFPVRLFSQGQIAAFAGENQQALLDLIDEAAGAAAQKDALEKARRRFLTLRSQVREIESRLRDRDGLVVRLQDVERKLKRFEEAHHAEVLKAYQLASRQELELDSQFQRVRELASSVLALAAELQSEDVPPGVFDAGKDAEPLGTIQRLARAVEKARGQIEATARGILEVVATEESALAAGVWRQQATKTRAAYAALKQQLQLQGINDPAEYGRLVQERQHLETERKRLEELLSTRDARQREAEAARVQVVAERKALTSVRRAFLDRELGSNPYVRIEIVPLGRDGTVIEASLRAELGAPPDKYADDIHTVTVSGQPDRGLVAELLAKLPDDLEAGTVELHRRLDLVKHRLLEACAGQAPFGSWFNKFLAEQTRKRPEFPDHLRAWFPEDGLRIEYSRQGDGTDFQPITQASTGQRAAAMLAFLLTHGDEPLILDQPEDDLDNHLIYDLVVRQIRENKLRRQLIVVTHNANIVVNGDAEMLYALDFQHGQCVVKQAGSLQDKAMRGEVCHVMEGGREAFHRRYRRLGKER